MRPDLPRLLTEGGRKGRSLSYRQLRRARCFDAGEVDEAGRLEPMRIRYDLLRRKQSTDKLNPLLRWLHQQCGLPWNEAYSDLCRRLDRRTLDGQHVRVHLSALLDLQPHPRGRGVRICPGPQARHGVAQGCGLTLPVWSPFVVCPGCRCLQRLW